MRVLLCVTAAILLGGCLAEEEPASTPRWVSSGGTSASQATLTGEGEAEVSGHVEAVGARDVTVEVYLDRECPEDPASAEHLASRVLQLGDVDGETAWSTKLKFQADPIFPRMVAYSIYRASNIAEPYAFMCVDFG